MRDEVRELIENNGFNVSRFGVAFSLEAAEFDELARDHPNRVTSDLILYSNADEHGNQSFVQIVRLRTFDQESHD